MNCMKNLITINSIGYHKVCDVYGIYFTVGKRRNKERSIKTNKSNYIITILLLQPFKLCIYFNLYDTLRVV